MSLAPQLAAAAMDEPPPVHTPLMQIPARSPPLKAHMRKSFHATRAPVEPRRLEGDMWLNDMTSQRSLGRVIKTVDRVDGRVIWTTICRVRVSHNLLVRQGRDEERRSLYNHRITFDNIPID